MDGKTDVFDRVIDHGRLNFGAETFEQFDGDFQFHGYRFKAVAGATITADITHKGSSSTLDTTLFVYGPRKTGFGEDPFALDDDSSWDDVIP